MQRRPHHARNASTSIDRVSASRNMMAGVSLSPLLSRLLEFLPDFLLVSSSKSLKGALLYVASSVSLVLSYEPQELVGRSVILPIQCHS